MRSSRQVLREIVEEMRVGLNAEFHENFRRKAFFDQPWKPRGDSGWKKTGKKKRERGSLLVVTGKLRRSLRAQATPTGVSFTSAMPYASMHNEGFEGWVTVPQHTRKETTAFRLVKGKRKLKRQKVRVRAHKVGSYKKFVRMPQRRFVGNHPEVEKLIHRIIDRQVELFRGEMDAHLRRHSRGIIY